MRLTYAPSPALKELDVLILDLGATGHRVSKWADEGKVEWMLEAIVLKNEAVKLKARSQKATTIVC